MHARLLPFAAVLFLAPLVSQGQEKDENPFKLAKVGDYVTYKMTTQFAGKDVESHTKQKVTAKSDTEVTVSTTMTIVGTTVPGQDTKIDLTKPFDFADALTKGKEFKEFKTKFEKTGEGKEKIKVGDRTYDCNWLTGKVVSEFLGKKLESEVKVWFSKSAPLSGRVKMEHKSNNVTIVQIELTESGNEK